ncbi:hypothetical protein B296_00022819 [Ensete ventricosum]|uniref:Uncharacterized protein n=1 Tax=Ensete ventricosum TaxID=4639 RepID=A0A426YD46_ENSVE|nr:hypothetical protein B296_00022819 [Ensete ventricosum]
MVEPHASFHLTLLRGAAGECIPRPSLALRHSCPDSTWRAGGDPSGRSNPYGRPNALAMAPNHDGVYVASNGCSNGAGALESRPSLDETPPDALAQCENTLAEIGVVREAVDDTAGAAKVRCFCFS